MENIFSWNTSLHFDVGFVPYQPLALLMLYSCSEMFSFHSPFTPLIVTDFRGRFLLHFLSQTPTLSGDVSVIMWPAGCRATAECTEKHGLPLPFRKLVCGSYSSTCYLAVQIRIVSIGKPACICLYYKL